MIGLSTAGGDTARSARAAAYRDYIGWRAARDPS